MGDLRVILATTVLAVGASLLSSTLLSWVAVAGVKPDLALVIVALMAMRRGSMPGQIAGFASGLLADTISVAPLGLTAMTRTVVGYVVGRMEGVISVDWLLLPAAVAVGATVLKALALAAVGLAVPWVSGRYGIGPSAFPVSFLIEAGLNAVAAPALYVLGEPVARHARARVPGAARPVATVNGPHADDSAPVSRIAGLRIALLCVLGGLALYLFVLQVIKGVEFEELAKRFAQRETVVPAQRGAIYDGSYTRPLVANRPAFSIDVTPALVQGDRDDLDALLTSLAEALDVEPEYLAGQVPMNESHLFQPIEVFSGADFPTVAYLGGAHRPVPGSELAQRAGARLQRPRRPGARDRLRGQDQRRGAPGPVQRGLPPWRHDRQERPGATV